MSVESDFHHIWKHVSHYVSHTSARSRCPALAAVTPAFTHATRLSSRPCCQLRLSFISLPFASRPQPRSSHPPASRLHRGSRPCVLRPALQSPSLSAHAWPPPRTVGLPPSPPARGRCWLAVGTPLTSTAAPGAPARPTADVWLPAWRHAGLGRLLYGPDTCSATVRTRSGARPGLTLPRQGPRLPGAAGTVRLSGQPVRQQARAGPEPSRPTAAALFPPGRALPGRAARSPDGRGPAPCTLQPPSGSVPWGSAHALPSPQPHP